MTTTIDLQDRIALVTGAGGGLGRCHALALARHGATVVVNDLSPAACEAVVAEIEQAGGRALPSPFSVTDRPTVFAAVDDIVGRLGRLDILINNAGILRDRTFAKMDLDDFALVVDVHLMGSVNVTKAAWPHMQSQGAGRIVFTTSSSGLYGNFGQSNYGAAKMALVGLMQTLALEGRKHDIRVNCLAPSAATQMTENLYSDEALRGLGADLVSPGVVALAADDAPTRTILLAGAGAFEQAHVTMTQGVWFGDAPDAAARIAGSWRQIGDRTDDIVPASGAEQYSMRSPRPVGTFSSSARAGDRRVRVRLQESGRRQRVDGQASPPPRRGAAGPGERRRRPSCPGGPPGPAHWRTGPGSCPGLSPPSDRALPDRPDACAGGVGLRVLSPQTSCG